MSLDLKDIHLTINTDNLEGTRCIFDFLEFLKHVRTTTYHGEVSEIPLHWPYIRKLAKMLVEEKRLVILKGRQMLCSWIIVAYAVWCCIAQENLIILIISKGQKEAQEMIRRAYEIYDRLPPFLKTMASLKDGPRNQQSIEFNTKSRIISLPSKADASRSVAAKIVFIDEAAYARELAGMLTAIAPQLGLESKLFIVSTPNPLPMGKEFSRVCKDAKTLGYKRLDLHFMLCPTYQNPEWEKMKRAEMSPQKFAYEFELSLASAGDSMIFPNFSDKNIWEGAFHPDEHYALVRCIDPGPRMGVIWFAEDRLGNIVVYREQYFHGGSFANRSKRILMYSGDEIYDTSVIDSADPIAKLELAKHGVFCRSCMKKDVYESIDMINMLISGDSLDTPMLMITNDCPKLIQQMREYVGDDVGMPVKNQYDHGIDGLRYGVQIRVRLRFNKSRGESIAQLEESDIEKEFGMDELGSPIDRDSDVETDFNESDFDIGMGI